MTAGCEVRGSRFEVALGRPFEPLGMSTARWTEVPVERVPLRDLVFTQQAVSVEGMVALAEDPARPSFCGDLYPHLVEYRGRLWVSDGHHRIVAALVRGERFTEARVLRRDEG